jgi:hypothetical protein
MKEGDLMENQLKELMRRKIKNEIEKINQDSASDLNLSNSINKAY